LSLAGEVQDDYVRSWVFSYFSFFFLIERKNERNKVTVVSWEAVSRQEEERLGISKGTRRRARW